MHLNLITEIPDEELLTTNELAKKWGCSRQFVIDRIDDGSLSYCDFTRPGSKRRNLRIPVSAARAFVEPRTIPARISA